MGAVLAADLEQVGEARGRDQRRAGAAFLQQRVGADGHPVGEDLDLAGLGAGPLQHRLDRRHHPVGLLAGRGRDLGGVDGAAVEQDRVGEGPADVDSEQHGVKLAGHSQVSRRTSPSGAEDDVDAVEGGVGLRAVGAQVAAARLAPASAAPARSPAPAGRGRRSAARGRRGCASARRSARPRRGSLRSAGRSATPGGAGAPAAAVSSSAAAAARPPKTKHSLSELEASRLAPCRPVQEHSPTA